jgi:hypothetical protein
MMNLTCCQKHQQQLEDQIALAAFTVPSCVVHSVPKGTGVVGHMPGKMQQCP